MESQHLASPLPSPSTTAIGTFFLNVNGIYNGINDESATAGMLICSFLRRCKKLPANFIQAQRDYFGAHTYELLEKPGIDSNIDRHGIIDILRPVRA